MRHVGYRTAIEIYRMACSQMYHFCKNRGLVWVWAYAWEHWYRPARWLLWARSAHPLLPVWRTTLALEAQWRVIKHDFIGKKALPTLLNLILLICEGFIVR